MFTTATGTMGNCETYQKVHIGGGGDALPVNARGDGGGDGDIAETNFYLLIRKYPTGRHRVLAHPENSLKIPHSRILIN